MQTIRIHEKSFRDVTFYSIKHISKVNFTQLDDEQWIMSLLISHHATSNFYQATVSNDWKDEFEKWFVVYDKLSITIKLFEPN